MESKIQKKIRRDEMFVTKGKMYGDLLIRVPIKFDIFGKISKPYKKLLFGLLKKNSGVFAYNFKDKYNFNGCIKNNMIEDFIETINKHTYTREFTDSQTYLDEFFVYYDKREKTWYFALNLYVLSERYCQWKQNKENKKVNFIPFKYDIYHNLDVNNRKEYDCVGKLSVYNKSKHYSIPLNGFDKTNSFMPKNGVYKFYINDNMYKHRDVDCLHPYENIKTENKKFKYDFGSGIICVLSYNKHKENKKHNKDKTKKHNNSVKC